MLGKSVSQSQSMAKDQHNLPTNNSMDSFKDIHIRIPGYDL